MEEAQQPAAVTLNESSKTKLLGFGDESESNNAVTYGLVVIPLHKQQVAEGILASLKTDFGAPPKSPLHCRELFSGHARGKGPWAHLSPDDVLRLYSSLCEAMSGAEFGRIVGFADTRMIPRKIPQDDWVPALKFGKKEVAAFCANAAVIPERQRVDLSEFSLWVDPDHTKIDWLGKRRQAYRAISMWIGHEPDEPQQVMPEPLSGTKPALLELADALAYISARALSAEGRRDKDFFRSVYKTLNPAVVELARGPDGGFGIQVPDFHPGFGPLLSQGRSSIR